MNKVRDRGRLLSACAWVAAVREAPVAALQDGLTDGPLAHSRRVIYPPKPTKNQCYISQTFPVNSARPPRTPAPLQKSGHKRKSPGSSHNSVDVGWGLRVYIGLGAPQLVSSSVSVSFVPPEGDMWGVSRFSRPAKRDLPQRCLRSPHRLFNRRQGKLEFGHLFFFLF